MLSRAYEACLSACICLLTYSSTSESCILSKGVRFAGRGGKVADLEVTVSVRARCSGRVVVVLVWFLDRFSKEVEAEYTQE
jgi:hypothetical protein